MGIEKPNLEKINIAEEEKEIIEAELSRIEDILKSLSNNDEDYVYADTGDSMEALDNMLHGNTAYLSTLSNRKEASVKIMRGNEKEKKEGLKQIEEWMKRVRELL